MADAIIMYTNGTTLSEWLVFDVNENDSYYLSSSGGIILSHENIMENDLNSLFTYDIKSDTFNYPTTLCFDKDSIQFYEEIQ